MSFTIGPHSRIGVVAPNGTGKCTLLRILAGHRRARLRRRSRATPPTATVGYLPQEPERRRGRDAARVSSRGAPASATPSARSTRRRAALAERDAGRRRRVRATRSTASSRSAPPTSTRGSARSCADLGLAERVLDLEMPALSGGQAARASLAAILLARFDVFLLDEPTNDLDFAGLDRLERFLPTELTGGAVIVSPRPCVPRPHDHQRARARRAHAHRVRVRRRLDGVPRRSARPRAATPRRSTPTTCTSAPSSASRAQRTAAVVGAGQGQGREERRDRQVHPPLPAHQQRARRGQGQDHRPGARTARSERGREAVGGLGPPDGDRGRAARRRGRRPARRRASCAAASFTLGPVDLEIHYGERVAILGSNGSGKTTLLDAALGRIPLDAGEAPSRPGRGRSASSTRRARVRRPRAAARALRARKRTGRRTKCDRCSPSSGSAPITCCARPTRSHPASAPGRRSRCSRRAASTASCSTSRRTTSTSRRSSSSSRRCAPSPERCSWSPTTASCSTPSPSPRRVELVDGS